MRIIGGKHRGRRIEAPQGEATRPTSDRAREALFSILEHRPPGLDGTRFLDLFAGSGAVGLEAASRGAGEVLLVEQDRAAAAIIRRNIEHLSEGGRVRLMTGDARRLPRAPAAFDVVFADPPWHEPLAERFFEQLVRNGWLAPDGLLVVELPADAPFAIGGEAGGSEAGGSEPQGGLTVELERRYGAARFVFVLQA